MRLLLTFLIFISSLQFNDFLDMYRDSFYPILDLLLGKLFPSCSPNLYSLCSVLEGNHQTTGRDISTVAHHS